MAVPLEAVNQISNSNITFTEMLRLGVTIYFYKCHFDELKD